MALLSKEEAKDLKNLIDATYGRRTRSVIIMDNSTVVLSAVQPETITNRVNMDIIKEKGRVSKEEFQQMIAENRLLEWAEVYGNYYGTPADKVREVLESGKDVLLEIDTQGALNVQKMFLKEGTFIFLLPPSLAELEKRIRGRGTETEEAIKRRLSAAIEEIPRGNNYDYIITNEVVSDVVNKILHIIEAERCAVYNNLDKLVQLENEKV